MNEATPGTSKGHHRRTSSLWVPPSRPVLANPTQRIWEKAETSGRALRQIIPFSKWIFRDEPSERKFRTIVPNNHPEPPPRYEHSNPRFATNRICTTKYSLVTFIPKNLFEQFHRLANVYFVFIVILNMFIGTFAKFLAFLPIGFVLSLTAIKDAIEDYRRYKSDQKINHQTCRVWDSSEGRYRKLEWKHVLVGDFVHLSHDEIIPADMLLLRSSDPSGLCYVETSNLDGESNLKQRKAASAMAKYHSSTVPLEFSPNLFNYNIALEEPSEDLYRFDGRFEVIEGEPPIPREQTILSKDNMLLRGCRIKNTDFVEGIVLYAGAETKAMLNNNGPRLKRSSLEKLTNWDIVWCVIILLILCTLGGILSSVWINKYEHPELVPFFAPTHQTFKNDGSIEFNVVREGVNNFFSFIIALQVLIPISLYVSIEIMKLGQVWLISNDLRLYYEPKDKKMQCRALNISEELGQIEYVMSDKTGTLTENQMIFRRCSVAGRDFGGMTVLSENTEAEATPKFTGSHSRDRGLEMMLTKGLRRGEGITSSSPLIPFFLTMTVCNTVVVNPRPHEDLMDDEGDFIFDADSGEYHCSKERRDKLKQQVQFSSDDTGLTGGRNTPDSLDSIDLNGDQALQDSSTTDQIDLLEFETETEIKIDIEPMDIGKDEQSSDKKEPEKKSKLQGILSKSRRTSFLNLSKIKNIADLSRFRRPSSKSSQSSLSVDVRSVLSYYDSESPDELALVEAAREYGMRLLKRQFDEVSIYTRGNAKQSKFKILHILAFDADRKRMSVIVREIVDGKPDGQVVLLCKGADTSVLPLLSETFCSTDEGGERVHKAQLHLSDYARDGLRTLCLARRLISDEEYQVWRVQHEEAELAVSNKDEKMTESASMIEKEFELLGVTAIEDRLQDGVPECIQSLREAGIRVWVLTGDKSETAINIAYSTRLFSESMDLLNISANGVQAVSELIDLYIERTERRSTISTFGLVLNGPCLDGCFALQNVDKFVLLLQRCRSVLCCRSTPLQKAALVDLAKTKLKGKVLAIGDGANDVSMIQKADVGIGLSGQEGMQAVMASDFSLARFRFLAPLLLVHGHWCYHRLANTILYFFFKNAMFVFTIFWYQIYCGFSSQVSIDPTYLMVYNLFFTSVPSLLYGCLDQDASYEILIENPVFYSQGRLKKKYKWYSFWLNMLDAVWQSTVTFWLTYGVYHDTDTDMWSFGTLQCAQLLVANSMHLILISRYWTFPFILSIIGSCLFFVGFAYGYNALPIDALNWFSVKDPPADVMKHCLTDANFWFVLLLSTVLSLLPRFLFICIRNTLHPSRILTKQIEISNEKPRHGLCRGKTPVTSQAIRMSSIEHQRY